MHAVRATAREAVDEPLDFPWVVAQEACVATREEQRLGLGATVLRRQQVGGHVGQERVEIGGEERRREGCPRDHQRRKAPNWPRDGWQGAGDDRGWVKGCAREAAERGWGLEAGCHEPDPWRERW